VSAIQNQSDAQDFFEFPEASVPSPGVYEDPNNWAKFVMEIISNVIGNYFGTVANSWGL
jgi:hypothetical protein